MPEFQPSERHSVSQSQLLAKAERPSRQSHAPTFGRSEVRRWQLYELERVQHRRLGQEWVPHWHSDWSIGAIVRGECRCSVGGRPLRATRGDLLAIAPGVVHTGALLAAADMAAVLVVMVYVPAYWLAQAGLAAPGSSGYVHCPTLVEVAEHLESPEEIQVWLTQAVELLQNDLPARQVDADPGPAARRLLELLQAAVLEGETSVTQLAFRCSVSREQLHRVVRRWTGMGPASYLRAIRINRAREMLLGGEPLSSVALACGFADQAHFTRWFRRSFGYTPGDLVSATAPSTLPALNDDALSAEAMATLGFKT